MTRLQHRTIRLIKEMAKVKPSIDTREKGKVRLEVSREKLMVILYHEWWDEIKHMNENQRWKFFLENAGWNDNDEYELMEVVEDIYKIKIQLEGI